MRRSASEVIRNLEMRIARLEKSSSMRTAKSSDFEIAYRRAEKKRPFTTEVLPSGERAIVAPVKDMLTLLDSLGYRVTDGRYENMRRDRTLFYLVDLGIDNHLFVLEEKEAYRPGRRIGYNFYK